MTQRFLAALLVLGFLHVAVEPVSAQTHKDERLGFQLRVPRKWTQIPLQTGEQWVVAKYVSDKSDFFTASDSGYTHEHTPTLRVVAFIEQFINAQDEDEGEEEEEAGEEEEPERSSSGPRFVRLYRDYDDFLKENFRGGYFFEDESTGEVNGVRVTRKQIKAENDSGSGHRLLLTWIYETDIGTVAVEFEVLEDAYKKKKSTIEKTLKSFKPIPRTKPLTMVSASASASFLSRFELERLDPAERGQRRRAQQEQVWARMTSDLPEGWEPMEVDDVKVLTRHDQKHAKAVVANIHAVASWLDETFPTIGPEEYVRLPIVRICKDAEEEYRFNQGSSFLSDMTEIVTHKDSGGSKGFEWEWINARTMNIWFYERDADLYFALPVWLRRGLEEVIESSSVKGSKIKFYRDDWETAWRDDAEPYGLERTMTMGQDEYRKMLQTTLRPEAQAVSLTRFLISGPGSKGKYKGLLNDYILNIDAVVAEIEQEEDKAEKREKPKTEEEEDAEIKERKKRIEAKEARILTEAYARTFEGWSDQRLSSLKKAYLKEVK